MWRQTDETLKGAMYQRQLYVHYFYLNTFTRISHYVENFVLLRYHILHGTKGWIYILFTCTVVSDWAIHLPGSAIQFFMSPINLFIGQGNRFFTSIQWAGADLRRSTSNPGSNKLIPGNSSMILLTGRGKYITKNCQIFKSFGSQTFLDKCISKHK